MKKILILESTFQYGVVNRFIADLADAFRAANHDVSIISIESSSFSEQLTEALPFLVGVFSFNTLGAELAIEGASLYDVYDIPFVTFLLDSPFHFWPRLFPSRLSTTICADASHAAFLNERFPEHETCFLMHGASYARGEEKARDMKVLFAGSGPDPREIEKESKALSPPLQKLVNDIKDAALYENTRSMVEIMQEGLQEKNVSLPLEESAFLYVLVDKQVRTARRLLCLRTLDRAGIPIDIFGRNWEVHRFKHHRIHASLPYAEMVYTMARAACVLHIGPNFSHGAHERVFSGMAQGAVVIADKNVCLGNLFSHETDIVFYEWDTLSSLPEKVGHVLGDDKLRRHIAVQGKKRVHAEHLWTHRAEKILEILHRLQIYRSQKR